MEPTTEITVGEENSVGSESKDVQSPKELAVMFPSPNWFYSRVLAVSSDGWVVYGAMTRGLCILQPVDDNYRIHIVSYAHADRISCVALSDDWLKDRRLLTGSIDGVVKQWRIQEEGEDVRLLPVNAHNVHKLEKEEIISVDYCDEGIAVTVGTSGVLVKWDLKANVTRVYKKLFRNLKLTCAARCPHDPLVFAVGTKQGVLFVVDFHAKANILCKVRGHDDEITSLSWCPQAEVIVQRAPKFSAACRMDKIRKTNADNVTVEETSELSTISDQEKTAITPKKLPQNDVGPEAINVQEEAPVTPTQVHQNDETSSRVDLDETKENEESVVAEDDMFDIYADHEHEEFGHSKYKPEEIYVPTEKPAENVDFLAECLKLKKDIIANKTKQEPSIQALVESLEKASISKNESQHNGTSKVEKMSGDSETQSHDSNESLKATETHTNLLMSIDKNGKSCLWSKSGKLLAHSVITARAKHNKMNLTHGASHWYKSDVLLTCDGKNNIYECNPLAIDSLNKMEWKVLHSTQKRGLYCITSAAPGVQTADSPEPDCDIWSLAQDRNIVLYSYAKKQVSIVYGTFGGYVYHIDPCPYDAQRVALACGDGNVRVCELGEDVTRPYGPVTCYWQNVQGRIAVTAWHPTRESLLAFATAEGRVGLIDTSANKEKPAKLLGAPLRRGVYSLSWDNSNTLYVCAMGELYTYNISKANTEVVKIDVTFEGKRWSPTEALWTERGLCVGSKDGEVAVMTATAPHLALAAAFSLQKIVQCIKWHPQSVTLSEEESPCKNWIAASANENHFVVFSFCEEDGTFKLKEVATLHGHKQPVVRLAWSPHRSAQILSTSQDATVRVWNISLSGEASCTSVFDRHQFNTLTAAWWPLPNRAEYILSGGGDHTLRLWNLDQFPPQLAENKPSTKNIPFAMALPENDSRKEKPKDSTKPTDASTNSSVGEEDTILIEEGKDDTMAVNYDQIKKRKIDKRCLLSLSHKQSTVNGLKACRKLLKKHVQKYGSGINGEGVCKEDKGSKDDSGVDFLKIFGTLDEFNELLDMEQEEHLSRERLDLWTTVGIMRGQIERVFQTAAAHNALSPFLLSIAPMVSHRFWKDQMQAYILQLDRNLTDEPQKPNLEYAVQLHSTTGVHRKLILLLSQHNVTGSVDMLVDLHMYREAYVLARVRHMDSLAQQLLNKWAVQMCETGNKVQAAICYLALGQLVEASTVLSKLTAQEALDVAAEIAKVSGQETFADSLMKKRDDISQQKTEEILKNLPDRLALHLKMRQDEAADENTAEKEDSISQQKTEEILKSAGKIGPSFENEKGSSIRKRN